MKKTKLKTWSCEACGYAQNFEPSLENMAFHFRGKNATADRCPGCGGELQVEKNKDKQFKKITK